MSNYCVFCKIVKGEIPSYKVYEDDAVIAFLDRTAINPGHVLIIAKDHTNTIIDTSDEILEKLIKVSKKISQALMDSVKAEGINIHINNFKVAGQIVNHLHIHIIPRYSGDGYKHWEGKPQEPEEMQKIAEKIQNSL